jgi:hypothetical protein
VVKEVADEKEVKRERQALVINEKEKKAVPTFGLKSKLGSSRAALKQSVMGSMLGKSRLAAPGEKVEAKNVAGFFNNRSVKASNPNRARLGAVSFFMHPKQTRTLSPLRATILTNSTDPDSRVDNFPSQASNVSVTDDGGADMNIRY